MQNDRIRKHSPVRLDDCGMAHAANILGDRWTLLILREAFYGVTRFEDIRNDTGIPRAVLTSRLKRLVDYGILLKKAYQETGQRKRFAYLLTAAGGELGILLASMMAWGDKHVLGKQPLLTIVDQKSGRPVKISYVDEHGKPIKAKEVGLRISNLK